VCLRVKEHCIQRGLAWDDSLATTSCGEQEYYEDLLRFYRYNYRVRGLFKVPVHASKSLLELLALPPLPSNGDGQKRVSA